MAEFVKGLVTVVLGDLLAHPLPKSFNGIEVGTVTGEGKELKAKFLSMGADFLTAMLGSAIPDEENLTMTFVKPSGKLLLRMVRRLLRLTRRPSLVDAHCCSFLSVHPRPGSSCSLGVLVLTIVTISAFASWVKRGVRPPLW
jgi:hypothetical protein